jgi:hypothetical protein
LVPRCVCGSIAWCSFSASVMLHTSAYVSIRQHMSAYDSIRMLSLSNVSIRMLSLSYSSTYEGMRLSRHVYTASVTRRLARAPHVRPAAFRSLRPHPLVA